MLHDGDECFTDEDEDIANEDIIGSIDIRNNSVHIQERQPLDTLENAFFQRVKSVILKSTCRCQPTMDEEDVGRLYRLLSAPDMHRRVRRMIDDAHATDELTGSGLTYDVHHEVHVSQQGDTTGTVGFSVWIRNKVKTRRTPPSSPVPCKIKL